MGDESDFSFRYLFEGKLLDVTMAEAFLRANGVQVYSIAVPDLSLWIPRKRILYVRETHYRDALEILIFHGCDVGFGYLNAISVLLGRELHDILPSEKLDAIRESLNRVNRNDSWQLVIFIVACMLLPVFFAFVALLVSLVNLIPIFPGYLS